MIKSISGILMICLLMQTVAWADFKTPSKIDIYIQDVTRKVKRNWRPPSNQTSYRLSISFKIAQDGRLADITIEKSSGNVQSDQSLINAVKDSAPFPPLPQEYSERYLTIPFTTAYHAYGQPLPKD